MQQLEAPPAPRLALCPEPESYWRACPVDCPPALWNLFLRDCGDELLRGLHAHSGVIAAFSVELAAVGEDRLCAFMRYLDEVHRIAADHRAMAERSREIELHCRRQMDAARAHTDAFRADADRRQEQLLNANSAAPELDRARFRIETLSHALEQANRRLVDASAHWERQLEGERKQALSALIVAKDQHLALERALEAERRGRASDLQKAQDMAAKLDAATQNVFHKGHELSALDQRAVEIQRSADLAIADMQDCTRKTLKLWQHSRDQEVGELKRHLELQKLGVAGGVSPEEADRSLLLVAALWHSAGKREPGDMSTEEISQSVEGVLNAWRGYFHRQLGAEPPLLRPTSSIVLSPLRVVAGQRASEVMAGNLPILEASALSTPNALPVHIPIGKAQAPCAKPAAGSDTCSRAAGPL